MFESFTEQPSFRLFWLWLNKTIKPVLQFPF